VSSTAGLNSGAGMANPVRNALLADLLKQAEQAKLKRDKDKVHQQARDLAAGDPLGILRKPALASPLNKLPQSTTMVKSQQGYDSTPPKTLPPDATAGNAEVQTKSIPLTLDEIEWLTSVAARTGHAAISGVLRRLVQWANTENPEAKKKIFLQIRCRRCSAGAKGGVKTQHDLELTNTEWQWLMNVKERCNHATVDKTLRIIVDFYMPLCKSDPDFEKKLVQAGWNGKSDRHQDAVTAAGARALGA